MSKCRHFVSLVITFWPSSPIQLCMLYFLLPDGVLRPCLIFLLLARVVRWWMRKYYTTTCHLATLFMHCVTELLWQATDALHVTVHFARPRGILVVAQPSNHQTLHCANHGWSHLLLHCATETTTVPIAVRIKRYRHVISHTRATIV